MAASPSTARAINDRLALRLLQQEGPLTAGQLKQLTGLSRPTVEGVVEGLIEAGLVVETAAEEGAARRQGRPARRFRFRAEAGHLLGLEIGVHRVAALLADLDGKVIGAQSRDVDETVDADERLERLRTAIAELLRRAGVPRGSLRAAPTSSQPPRTDIFGTWLLAPAAPDPRRAGTSRPQPMMNFLTPAGAAAVAAYDPFKDDPTFRCDPVAIRRVWGAPGTPLQIAREGRNVVLRHEWMDVRRVIHMNMKTHPASGLRSSLGHSIGRWEGSTLVIETANYSRGVLNQYVEQPGQPTRGLLHSDKLTSVERLFLDAARQRLVVEIDLEDPEYFTKPFPRGTLEYAPSDLKIEPFNCSPEGLTGPLRK